MRLGNAARSLSGNALYFWRAGAKRSQPPAPLEVPSRTRSFRHIRRSARLVGDKPFQRRTGGNALEPLRLPIKLLQRRQCVVLPKLGLLHRRFQDANGLIVDLQRHWKRMPILAAVRQRKPRRIAEAARRAMHHLSD